jgi:hypothetical protein
MARVSTTRVGVLEACCIIGTWVRDHLLREAWPGPLGMSPRVAARVLLGFPYATTFDAAPCSRVSMGLPLYIFTYPKAIHHLTFGSTPFSNTL